MNAPVVFDFHDFTANGIASDLYGYGLGLGLSSNQSALNAAQIAAPLGEINRTLNSQLLGTGAGMGTASSSGNWLSNLGTFMNPLKSNALGSGSTQGSTAADILSKIGVGRIATILAGLLLIAFGLYAFSASSVTSAISSLAQKATS